jgi:8-oxo-dGTP diphosphatase
MKTINVVAGIIFDQQREHVLLALRKPDQHQGGRWEFPGGKIEPDESQVDALARELLEEVNLCVDHSCHRQSLEHRYTDKHVQLHFYDVTRFTGTPAGCEGQELRWVAIPELSSLAFPYANQPIVDQLVAEASGT